MSDPCEGKKAGTKLSDGKICKGILDTIDGKAKSRMGRKFQNKNLQAVTWVDDDDDDDDDAVVTMLNERKELPHNPNFGMGDDDLTQEDYDRADKFTKSGGRRRRKKKKTRRKKKKRRRTKKKKRRRTKKKKRRRTKKKKKRRRKRKRKTRRKKGGDRTVDVGGILVTNVYNKNKQPVGVRLANAIRETFNKDYDKHCESYCGRLYPSSSTRNKNAVTGKTSCVEACKKEVDTFRQHVFKMPPRDHD